ncbi:MAG: hypothetical protein O7G85_13970, partial [Planctomycetota bacterium]|nr:hypothetical protein [Planctomycetota bacterium]
MAKKKKATTRKKASKRSPRKTKAKRKPVLLGSQRAIAKHFKRSVATIHEWTKRSDWVFEKPSDRNRILASEIKKWM